MSEVIYNIEDIQFIAQDHPIVKLRRTLDGRNIDLNERVIVLQEIHVEILVGFGHIDFSSIVNLCPPLDLRNEQRQEELDVLSGYRHGGMLDVFDEQGFDPEGELSNACAVNELRLL